MLFYDWERSSWSGLRAPRYFPVLMSVMITSSTVQRSISFLRRQLCVFPVAFTEN